MSHGAAFRGQPLLLLVGLLAGWIALRAALWESPFAELKVFPPTFVRAIATPGALPFNSTQVGDPEAGNPRASSPLVVPPARASFEALPPLSPPGPVDGSYTARPMPRPLPLVSPRVAIGSNVLLAAGLSQEQLPPEIASFVRRPDAVPVPSGIVPPAVSRPTASPWSADSWLMLREGTTRALAAARPSYGRSQAGAVIRFSLAPGSPLRSLAYVRASAALSGPREREVAGGLSTRPLAKVPVRLAVEARIGEDGSGTRVRPAIYAVSEFRPLALPFGARGEAYVQGGYVGGKFATAFVDGQARIERPVIRRGEAELSAGAGAWGGAQTGAARLDIGPTAAVSFRLGDARGRLAADYRFRVAGDAEPQSGPSLTLSAGF